MIIVKAFEPGFKCRGYQYKGIGEKNITDKANAARCGFHGAEDPLDCAVHYSHIPNAVFCICEAEGDIDEDAVDSKITCTELTIKRILTMPEYVMLCMLYLFEHPHRRRSSRLDINTGEARNGFCVVLGKNPRACGKDGDVLGFVTQGKNGEMMQIALLVVGSNGIKPDVYYRVTAEGEGVECDDQ